MKPMMASIAVRTVIEQILDQCLLCHQTKKMVQVYIKTPVEHLIQFGLRLNLPNVKSSKIE